MSVAKSQIVLLGSIKYEYECIMLKHDIAYKDNEIFITMSSFK